MGVDGEGLILTRLGCRTIYIHGTLIEDDLFRNIIAVMEFVFA